MSTPIVVLAALGAGVLVRQLFVLAAIGRSVRFLHRRTAAPTAGRHGERCGATFFIVLPVLREAAIVADAAAHFQRLAERHTAQLVVVTTAREVAEAPAHPGAADTIGRVAELAATGKILHLHHPDPSGLKGDQLNHAAAHCASILGDVPAEHAFLVCYDADSRPPVDSLTQFEAAIAAHPQASIFHQSSRFELRQGRAGGAARDLLPRTICDAGALRANRFVLGFELPRLLNRSTTAGTLKRWACSYVYAHVTGHGLCVQLATLTTLPFPARSPLEDMHFSFYVGSRALPIVAVPSLDRAEVPDTVSAQIRQSARWFAGPARFRRYLADPATQRGTRARIQAASAAGSAAEWLACAVVPAATILLLGHPSAAIRALAGATIVAYGAQLWLTEAALGAAGPGRRLARVLACPIATTLFGLGGIIGAVRLLRGATDASKTERRPVL